MQMAIPKVPTSAGSGRVSPDESSMSELRKSTDTSFEQEGKQRAHLFVSDFSAPLSL